MKNNQHQHKICAEILYVLYEKALKKESFSQELEIYKKKVKGFPQLSLLKEPSLEEIAIRYHLHLKLSNIPIKENKLLPSSHQKSPWDQNKNKNQSKKIKPFGKCAIYLDHLLSTYNVAHILRTCEALRIGSVYFSKGAPPLEKSRLHKNSFGATELVPLYYDVDLSTLPRPIIAFDTFDEEIDDEEIEKKAKSVVNLFEFTFPKKFTLILGNEEKGISQAALKEADLFLTIPLTGEQKSLNVASAFAMAAFQITKSF